MKPMPTLQGCTTSLSTYLILKRDNQVLLLLRKNTGYYDGYWGLVAGHVEEGESATTAMAREAFEEAGILVRPDQLKPVHILHRLSDRPYINIFFECHEWEGTIVNKEPEKCGGLEFFSLEALPPNTIEHIQHVLTTKEFYSEHGWATPASSN